MLKPQLSKIPKPTRYQNAAIDYYMGLTNSDYLYYGYWEPLPTHGEELTLTRLRVAQEHLLIVSLYDLGFSQV